MPNVVAHNPDSRPLPPGWSSHRDENKYWYYVNENTIPPQKTYVHPSGGHPALPSTWVQNTNPLPQVARAEQLHASLLNSASGTLQTLLPRNLVPGASSASPPPGRYTPSPSGLIFQSPPGSGTRPYHLQLSSPPIQYSTQASAEGYPGQVLTQPTLSVNGSVGYHQPTMYIQPPSPQPQQHIGLFNVPKHTLYTPAVPSEYVTGYHTSHTPLPPHPTQEPFTTELTVHRHDHDVKQTFKKVGKAALKVGELAIQVTTGVSAKDIDEVATALKDIFKSDNSDSKPLGISQSDLQAVLDGAPDANYEAVIQALMKQQQQQQGSEVATAASQPTPPAVDYAALVAVLEGIQGQMNLLTAQGVSLPSGSGQVGLAGQGTVTEQAGFVGQVELAERVVLLQQNTLDIQLTAPDGQQQINDIYQQQQDILNLVAQQQQDAQLALLLQQEEGAQLTQQQP
ncbi:hypothetical protein C0995_007937 [Termitomyces sp. Mi166|nr:hypothetical protein C0995_007937 [Termitomyces sp. Mi166\